MICGVVLSLSDLVFKRHETDPLLNSLKQRAVKKGQMQQKRRKNSANFIAIKCKQRKKIVEVTNQQRSSLKSGRSCPSLALKLLTIHIKPSISTLSQPLQMAAHASDWGDLLN